MDIFISNDLANKRELFLISKIFPESKPIILTTSSYNIDEYKVISKNKSKIFTSFFIFWSKFSFLLSHPTSARTNAHYIKRAPYITNYFVRSFLDIFFKFKRTFPNLFLDFNKVLLIPFCYLYFLKFLRPKFKRRVFFDPISVKNPDLWKFIIYFYFHPRYKLIGLVRSWDNPFYAQFFSFADEYYFWSTSMFDDFKKVHRKKVKYKIIGPALFNSFQEICNGISLPLNQKKTINIGYACAFPEPRLAEVEIRLLEYFIHPITKSNINFKVNLRGYPNLTKDFYKKIISNEKHVIVSDFETNPVDRYSDSHERISLDSDAYKLEFLKNQDFFLSLATSFTIEAALANSRIIHIPGAKLTNKEFCKYKDILDYISTADHITKYFNNSLMLLKHPSELKELLDIKTDNQDYFNSNKQLLENLGF